MPTSTPTPTLFAASDPVLDELKNQGYEQQTELFSFVVSYSENGFVAGGPDDDNPLPPQLSIFNKTGEMYTYLQYISEQEDNFHLLFFQSKATETKLIADIDVSKLNDRIGRFLDPSTGKVLFPPLQCFPYGWVDINANNQPDIPVAFIWGNQLTRSEVHIFELTQNLTIVDITQNLPGIISPWRFELDSPIHFVIDIAWANHDCIYPPIDTFWIYHWDNEQGTFVDVTSLFDVSPRIATLKAEVTSAYGNPFEPPKNLGPIVSVLVTYDKFGQRDDGWQEFLEMTNLEHWPNTGSASLKWLQADIAHFKKQYETGLPFSPNNYCGQ